MQPSSKDAVVEFLRDRKFSTVLDVPAGAGWLQQRLGSEVKIDGIDLYVDEQPGYRKFWKYDLDEGLPSDCVGYDLICCCEGLEHVGSPLLLLRHFHRALNPGGILIVTTPNVWYPQARLQYAFRGFFPSFPPLADKVKPGTHMHITPWSYPQLYIFCKLAGFGPPMLVPESLSKPKHFFERIVGLPAKWYCRGKESRAKTDEEREFWRQSGTQQSLLSRHLIIAVTKDAD